MCPPSAPSKQAENNNGSHEDGMDVENARFSREQTIDESPMTSSSNEKEKDNENIVAVDSDTTRSTSETGSENAIQQHKESSRRQTSDELKDSLTVKDGDDSSEERQLESFEDQANFVQSLLLTFLTPLLKLGSKKVLGVEDVGVPSRRDRAAASYDAVHEAWLHEVELAKKKTAALQAKKKKTSKENETATKTIEPSLSLAMLKAFGTWKVIYALFLYIVAALITFVPVLLLNDLVRYFEEGGAGSGYKGYAHPWVEVVGLGVIPFLASLFQTRHSYIMTHFAVFVRTGCSTLLYGKSLNISATGRSKTSTGQVVNMMSNDTNQLMRFLQFAGMSFVAPLQIVTSLSLIFQQVGNAMWVGVLYMALLVPVNFKIFGISGKMRRKVLKFSDSRVKMMNEVLSGIRIIKFYAWEKPFEKEVGKIRGKELEALTKLTYVTQMGFSVILMSAPLVQIVLVFLTYVQIQEDPLTASVAFTTVALFQIMRFPFAVLPMGFLQYIQSKIAIRRIGGYLQLPELDNCVSHTKPPNEPDDSPLAREASVSMQNCSFSWIDGNAEVKALDGTRGPQGKKSRKSFLKKSKKEVTKKDPAAQAADEEKAAKAAPVVLRDISCSIEAGSLVAVVGEVGSGKSSLLSAMLGEMEPLDGARVYIPKDEHSKDIPNFTAYCTQSPWVVNDTVRGNILFGRELNEQRYEAVISACALTDDLSVLPAGDMTEIGERGINLSGGQKARVCLARALYSEQTKLALFDDPLSAVDAHVGEHLFNNAISGKISAGMTRVLVTHHVHYLARCDSVIVMENGRIAHQGRYEHLLAKGVDFSGAVEVEKIEENDDEKMKEESEKSLVKDNEKKHESERGGSKNEKGEKAESSATQTAASKKKGGLIKEEEREEGNVAGKAYGHYAKAGGLIPAIAVLVAQGCSRGFEIGSSFWLAAWSANSIKAVQGGGKPSDSETTVYLVVYAVLGILGILSLTVRGLSMAVHRLRAARTLHDELTRSVLRAPVSFFDVTPTGRVLNRFAHDMDKVDLELTHSLGQGLNTIFNVLGALGAIVAATKGTFLVPMVPLGWMYYIIQNWFRKSSTELQRVTSMTISPIFADFSQTLTGTPTIRAYGERSRFFLRCQSSFDKNNASYVLMQLANLWLGLRLEILGGFVGAFIGGIAVATAPSGFIPAGWLGLALTFSSEITTYLKHGVRMIATLEADMSSVERILQYAHHLDHEAPDRIPSKDPPEGTWPVKGEINISHASMRYRDGPLVLKDLSLDIKGGEKVGIVGRTGSGKSSLMIALFRISELDKGGEIRIDNVNISEIGTDALRSNISIIPQDPVLFSNTVKYNLDPFGTKTKDELWEALEKVRLRDAIANLPCELDEQVAEGGENFSQGQRQLLCIARSLLRKPKVLVMDEATASIDNTTDAAIQGMIRENFSDATVLTIAHRLNTIMDSDRVLVLEDGNLAEFDSPEALMAKKDGLFASLVEKSRESRGETVE